ncbi:MAG TPA: hypothetical protein EYN92_05525, partial [Dehalococcoidia bacterium]|nr:hypothetical protein [Dehalococcoidia bacterium]
EAAILTIDGVGEWATASYGYGSGTELRLLGQMNYPHSLGLLYSAFTYYCGFRINSGEYKLMGLAPYGRPIYVEMIKENLVDIFADGSINLNMDFFSFTSGKNTINSKFCKLFNGPPRKPESELTQKEMDLAHSIQVVTEEIILSMANFVRKETGKEYLCLAGGVALNCVANGKLLRDGPFKDIWIQPASGDAGCALGAALALYYKDKKSVSKRYEQGGSLFGPQFNRYETENHLIENQIPYSVVEKEERSEVIADLIQNGKIVGHFSGRMEFGPRALGSRSILGDPRKAKTQSVMNLKIKYRESFRPFAPSVLSEEASSYFDLDRESPYMLIVASVIEEIRYDNPKVEDIIGRVNQKRSSIPAITHVDYSARVQTVNEEHNPEYYNLIKSFYEKTGCAVLVNTSFNVRGEPIVCTPEDAYRCFMRTEMDVLILDNLILFKEEQPIWHEKTAWEEEFELD